MENKWDVFWDRRQKPLSEKVQGYFYNNVKHIMKYLRQAYGTLDLTGKKCLEVGSGRGTVSDMLDNHNLGLATFRCDIRDKQVKPNFLWNKCSVFDLCGFYGTGKFDIILSYGLLEHFDDIGQLTAIREMLYATKSMGINIHYVVPKKLTNIREDDSVFRSECEFILDEFKDRVEWVFPAFPKYAKSWRTNKYRGKGFFLGLRRI